jgi:hypothetical protein
MEQPLAAAALALDFIQQLPSQSETPLSGILTRQRKLFEPEIRKNHGQITPHASGDLVALFSKPVSALICALSLHRMFTALSQSLPELENFQLRIGIHSEATTDDDTQAQQKCIEIAHELKELALRGNILVSRAVASTIDETWPVHLRPAGNHKLAAAPKAFAVFELMPPQKPLPVIATSRSARVRLPLAAAIGLVIMGGTAYGYLYQSGAVEWPPAPGAWLETARETAQQQLHSSVDSLESSTRAWLETVRETAQLQLDSSIDSLESRARAIVSREPSISRGEALQKAAASLPAEPSPDSDAVSIASSEPLLARGEALQKAAASLPAEPSPDSDAVSIASSEGAASSQAPISWGETLQRAAASLWKPREPSPDSDEVSTAALEEPAEDAAIVQPAKPGSLQSTLPEAETARQQQVAAATEAPAKLAAPAKPAAPMSVQHGSVAVPQPEEQQQPQQQQKQKEGSSQIAAASLPEKQTVPQVQPAQSATPAPSEITELDAPAGSSTATT